MFQGKRDDRRAYPVGGIQVIFRKPLGDALLSIGEGTPRGGKVSPLESILITPHDEPISIVTAAVPSGS
jgi:hypothetical protein